jgi:hypothetical protein
MHALGEEAGDAVGGVGELGAAREEGKSAWRSPAFLLQAAMYSY